MSVRDPTGVGVEGNSAQVLAQDREHRRRHGMPPRSAGRLVARRHDPLCTPVRHRRNGHPQLQRQGARGGPTVRARLEAGGQTGSRPWCMERICVAHPGDGGSSAGLAPPAVQPMGVEGRGAGVVGPASCQRRDRVNHREGCAPAVARAGAGDPEVGGGTGVPAPLPLGLARRALDGRQGGLRRRPSTAVPV
jgi:hypothetical protein